MEPDTMGVRPGEIQPEIWLGKGLNLTPSRINLARIQPFKGKVGQVKILLVYEPFPPAIF
jgi:hypothetical protein